MSAPNPFQSTERRTNIEGPFQREEVQLANRNNGILLEGLRYAVTPVGMHYLLSHFDVPYIADDNWQVEISGRVARAQCISVHDIRALPARTLPVTLECAGNGRGTMSPRYPSMPWMCEAVGTAEWTGTPLRHVLEQAGMLDDAIEVAFIGADRGFDSGREHAFGRSLRRDLALSDDVLLVWAMNGQPLLPQHGYPLRLIVPGWYGMASVKWLARIEALDRAYDGFQQAVGYHYRPEPDGPRTPITHMRVKSLMVPPGIPDWYTRRRLVDAGDVALTGRAWSGGGVPISKVEVSIDGNWVAAELDPPLGRFAWHGWRCIWHAEPGEHELACRATDANGETQPLETRWDASGFGNNAVQRMQVMVRAKP